jgi:hypothetical protein
LALETVACDFAASHPFSLSNLVATLSIKSIVRDSDLFD